MLKNKGKETTLVILLVPVSHKTEVIQDRLGELSEQDVESEPLQLSSGFVIVFIMYDNSQK